MRSQQPVRIVRIAQHSPQSQDVATSTTGYSHQTLLGDKLDMINMLVAKAMVPQLN